MGAHQKVLPINVLLINDTEVRIENFGIQLGSLLLTILARCTFRADVDRCGDPDREPCLSAKLHEVPRKNR
jgi:hypothetical protein